MKNSQSAEKKGPLNEERILQLVLEIDGRAVREKECKAVVTPKGAWVKLAEGAGLIPLTGTYMLQQLEKEKSSLPQWARDRLKQVVVMRVGQSQQDLYRFISRSGRIEFFSSGHREGLTVLRHTTAHVMAAAIKELFPKVQFATGPVIDTGFYYDLDGVELKKADFPALEAVMKKLVAARLANQRQVVSRAQALKLFSAAPYKKEIINALAEDEVLTYYQMGEFVDLCRGPHLPHTGFIKGFKLLKIAGAYWRGNKNNKMLTRLYGTSFASEKQLKSHLKNLQEAEKRDHNKLARQLEYFTTDERVGSGLPLLTGRGAKLRKILQQFVEAEEEKLGYEHTLTPYLAKSELYKISGHWQHYKEDMFVIHQPEGEKEGDYALRPMTCPFHFCLYTAKRRSYRELPVRYAETSTLFRNEASGEMHGLIRVRQFTLADGHIICLPEQLEQEFQACLSLISHFLNTLGLTDYYYRLSKWDPAKKEKYIDNPQAWEETQNTMRSLLARSALEYTEESGEAAFYGPKLDVQMKNIHGKEDTFMTVQIDFALPERFGMHYLDKNDQEQVPLVIHRSSIGCYERTIALLFEKYAGAFPFWLAPEQLCLLTINEKTHCYAKELAARLQQEGFRIKTDFRNASLGKKIKTAQQQRIPLLITLGEKEADSRTLSLRTLKGVVKQGLSWESFITTCRKMDSTKTAKISFEN